MRTERTPKDLERATWRMYDADARLSAERHVPYEVDTALRNWRSLLPPHPYVLDIGCGFGPLLDPLSELRIGRYLGIDPAEKALEIGRKRYPGKQFRRGSWQELPELVPERVDGFIAGHSLMHVPRADVPCALRGLAEVLQPSAAGLIVTALGTEDLVLTHEERPLIPRGHRILLTEWTPEALQPLLFAADFKIVPHYSGYDDRKLWVVVLKR